jgi:hypothetical protein
MTNDENTVNCTSMDKIETNGVEFTEGKARNLFNELPGSMALQFVDKQLPPLAVYALQHAISTLGEILTKCIETVMFTCLESPAVQNAITESFEDAIVRGIEMYFAANECTILEASPVWKAKIADYELPKCKEKAIGEKECKDCKFYKDMPDPEVPDTMDLLQDKMMTALRNIIMTSIEKAFSTVFFGRIIMNWSVSPCTSDKIKELMTNVVEKEAEAEAEHVNNNGGMTLIGKKVKTWEPLLGNDNEGLRGVKFKIVDT